MSRSDKDLISLLKITDKTRVLDIGGSMKQHTDIKVDTLVDIIRPEEAPYSASKLLAKKFVRVDIVNEPLPFKDKEFDVCLCTHTIEDLPNPVPIIKEMSRVAKRGYLATPSFGKDITFSHIDLTQHGVGFVRVPGLAHHKWLFENQNGKLIITPKNYPILYSSSFQVTDWKGEEEMELVWSGKIDFEQISELSSHELAKKYKRFISENQAKIKRGLALVFLDNPLYFLKETVKYFLRRGPSFKYG